MVPPIIIPCEFGTIVINMDVFVFAVILLLIYRRYSSYIMKLYHFDRAPQKESKFAYSIINIISVVFMLISLILVISVDSN
jgi:uncharacterized membrane protein